MIEFKLNSTIDCSYINITSEMTKNLIANNIKHNNTDKVKGLIIQDFLLFENLIFLIHGKVISCYDLNDNNKLIGHYNEKIDKENFYDFENEPNTIWMLDKRYLDTTGRWKILVAFNGGDVKEVIVSRS